MLPVAADVGLYPVHELLQVDQAAEAATLDEASAALRDIAQLLQAAPADTAQQQLSSVHQQLDAIIAQLPSNFFDPLVPESSLNESQVC